MLSKDAQLTTYRVLCTMFGSCAVFWFLCVYLPGLGSGILAVRAREALQSGRTRDAIRYGTWSIRLDPTNGDGRIVLGEALAVADRPEEAAHELMAGIAVLKARGIYVSTREYYILGCEYEKAGRLRPARDWLRRAYLLAARDWWRQAADMHEGDWSRLAEEKVKQGGS